MTALALQRLASRTRRERLLQVYLDEAERLIAELDAEDGDLDLEPSLAGMGGFPGSGDDREADYIGGLNTAVSDSEPSLGSLGGTAQSRGSQLRWTSPDNGDLEQEHDGREPQCEDEGAQCEDEGSYRDGDYEPDLDGDGTPNRPWEIGSRPMWQIDGADRRQEFDPDDDPGEFIARCEVGLS